LTHPISIDYIEKIREVAMADMEKVEKTEEEHPTREQWKTLHDAASGLRRIKPWEWMSEEDIFGVQDPESGETGWCCFLRSAKGAGAGSFLVYRGAEGLRAYRRVRDGDFPEEDGIGPLAFQRLLELSFLDRASLDERDLHVIRDLGLQFRGKGAWPKFRSHRPGYIPWFLMGGEADFLTTVLLEARKVALRCKKDKSILGDSSSFAEGSLLVRVPRRKGGALAWKDERRKPELPAEEPCRIDLGPVDELRLERIRRGSPPGKQVLEVDVFLAPFTVAEDDETRPRFPYVIILVDHRRGKVVGFNMPETPRSGDDLRDFFIDAVEKSHALPGEILVRCREAEALVEPVTSRLGVKLTRVENLLMSEEVRSYLIERFMP
jgi:hypothetical protein